MVGTRVGKENQTILNMPIMVHWSSVCNAAKWEWSYQREEMPIERLALHVYATLFLSYYTILRVLEVLVVPFILWFAMISLFVILGEVFKKQWVRLMVTVRPSSLASLAQSSACSGLIWATYVWRIEDQEFSWLPWLPPTSFWRDIPVRFGPGIQSCDDWIFFSGRCQERCWIGIQHKCGNRTCAGRLNSFGEWGPGSEY